jgi:hypothetical protein
MSGSKSESTSQNQSTNDTFIDPTQAPFLGDLFRQGSDLAGGQMGAGSDFQNFNSAAMGALQGMFQPNQQNNEFLQQQIGMGQNMINENLQQNILPSVGSGAQASGQFGGGRQGVAEGIALRDANRQSSDFSQQLIGQDNQQQQQRALQALGMAGGIGGLAFSPLQNLRGLLGNSTVLSQGQSTGGSESKSASAGMGD